MTHSPSIPPRRSCAGTLGALVFLAVLLFGATSSPDPLIRIACRLSLGAFLATWSWLRLRPDARPVRLAVGLLILAGTSFLAVAGLTAAWGGGALNGRVTDDHYVLTAHGHDRETTAARYYIVATVETLMFVTWPLVFLLGARLDVRPPGRRLPPTQAAQQ